MVPRAYTNVLKPTQVWVVLFSGFTQRSDQLSGMQRLWKKLDVYRRPGVHVALREWDARYDRLAERISLLTQDDPAPPAIVVAGYSYGGETAIRFSEQLGRRGLPVHRLILCDAVRRWLSRIPTPSSLLPWWNFKIPANIHRVEWFRQNVNYPRGHFVKAIDESVTEVLPEVVLTRAHQYCDDAPEFHEAVIEAVEGLV